MIESLKKTGLVLFLSALFFACGAKSKTQADTISPNLKTHENSVEILSNNSFNSTNCPFYFSKLKFCASLIWTQKPNSEDMGSAKLVFYHPTNNPEKGPFLDPNNSVGAKLWMPSMGHGSSPIKVSQLQDANGNKLVGQYQADNIYFSMPGEWEFWILLKQNNKIVDQTKLNMNPDL